MGRVKCFDINTNHFFEESDHFFKSCYFSGKVYEDKCENVIILSRYFEMPVVQSSGVPGNFVRGGGGFNKFS